LAKEKKIKKRFTNKSQKKGKQPSPGRHHTMLFKNTISLTQEARTPQLLLKKMDSTLLYVSDNDQIA
jgi:hypothetical protein